MEAAVAALQRVLAVEPENYRHYLNLAALFWENGRQSDARRYIQQLLDKKQEPEANIIHAARFYIQKNSMEDAEELLQKGIEKYGSSFDLHLLLSEIFVNTGRSQPAIELLRQCLTFSQNPAAPDIVRTKIALARIHLMNRELKAAEAYINEVTAEVPSSIDAHYLKGTISLSKGEGVNAVSEFRTVINEKPEFIEGYIHLSQAHVLNREYALAEDTLRRALRMDPDSVEAAIALSRLHIMLGDTAAASRQLNEILEKNPDAVSAVALLGDLLWVQRDLRAAEKQYRRLLTLAPDRDLGYRKLSRFYRSTGQLQNAREVLEQGLARREPSPDLQAALIQNCFSLERFDEALTRSRRFAEQHPENPIAWYLLGKSQAESRRTTEAEQSFKKALEIRPDFQAAHIDLARLYIARRDTATAVRRLEHAIELDPSDPITYLSLGQLHYQRGETVQAVRTLEKAVEHNPQFWPALNNLAFLLSEQDGSAEALARSLDYAQRALEVRPRDPQILDTLGWIYYKLGDPNRALGLLETALQDAPDNPMINFHAGIVYFHVGNHRLARSRLETVLRTTDENFPERAEARRILAEIP
ncbi:MAG TPA: tetratricopeptide repeat protein [Desulfobacterales bacterium]